MNGVILFLPRIILALAALLVATATAAAQQEFKAGISDPVNTVLAWWMGEAGGFYSAQGLKGSILHMESRSRGAAAPRDGAPHAVQCWGSSVVRLHRAGG